MPQPIVILTPAWWSALHPGGSLNWPYISPVVGPPERPLLFADAHHSGYQRALTLALH